MFTNQKPERSGEIERDAIDALELAGFVGAPKEKRGMMNGFNTRLLFFIRPVKEEKTE